MPKSASASSVRAGPQLSDEPENFAFVDGKGDIYELARSARAAHLERWLSPRDRPRRELVVDAFARHQFSQSAIVDRRRRKGADLLAVAKDRHAFGDLDHFVQPVTYKDDADPLLPEAMDGREQEVHLMPGERRGRLVHEQDARVRGEATTDGDDLALCDGQLANERVERNWRREASERFLGRPPHRLSRRTPHGRG